MLGEENILFFLIFVIGGVVFGALLMYLIMDARRNKQGARVESPTQPLPEEPSVEDTGRPAEFQETAGESDPLSLKNNGNRKLLVGFWRDTKTGSMIVEMDNQVFENTTQMEEPLRLRFERTLREGAQWMDLFLSKHGIEKPKEPESQAAPAAANAASVTEVNNETPAKKLSIVQQVDEILQEMLLSTPYHNQNIRLTEMYNKGVVVWVGQTYYEGIDAVPDENIKKIIKIAVKKWEETYGN